MPTHSRIEKPVWDPQLFSYLLYFWKASFIGTCLAGAIFGFVVAIPKFTMDFFWIGIIGLFFGCLTAGSFAIPIYITVIACTWNWFSRFRIVFATIAGITTGVLTTATTFSPSVYHISFASGLALAGVLGGTGAFLATYLFTTRTNMGRELRAQAIATHWQYSVRSLLVRTAVIALLVFLWTAAIRAML